MQNLAEKEIYYSANQFKNGLSQLVESGVTKLIVHDPKITSTKDKFLNFLELASTDAPEVFYVFYLDPKVLDKEVCFSLSKLYCSLQISLDNSVDKKMLTKKADLLNRNGLVFGFDLEIVGQKNDTVKIFRDRLDFALSTYPNHIDFSQLGLTNLPSATASFSAKDIKFAFDCAFACSVFYSAGRAVPWFLSLLKPLRIPPSRFFADFSEWLRCNNYSENKGFDPFAVKHVDIEKMQLLFLQMKYEEKNVSHIFPVAKEIIRLNGAFSRLAGEGEETELELDYNPDDLFSPYSQDVVAFSENVYMEHCLIRIFTAVDEYGQEFPNYKILR